VQRVEDYAYRHGVSGRTANEISAREHLTVLALASEFVDSAVSKTCNVGDNVSYDDFKNLYYDAWKMGCKGITTFRAAGKRYGILNEVKEEEEPKAEACYIDPDTGLKSCE
jgi:ribonucleoside-diphosphate reductase alpha chain